MTPRPTRPIPSTPTSLTHYDTNELIPTSDLDALSQIEPLSDESLSALNRLARYKAPPDPYPVPKGRAGVLIALFGSRTGNSLNVVLSTRSESLRTFPGNVALPGGKMDDTDINLEATARREAFEELGLPINPETIRYLTTLPPILTRAMLLVTAVVVFVLDYSLKPELNPSEVSSIFSFPLSGFLTSSSSNPALANSIPPQVTNGEVLYHYSDDYPWFEGVPHRFHSFETKMKPVTGLTAQILIMCAEIAYGRPTDFERSAPGEMSRERLIECASKEAKWKRIRGIELDEEEEDGDGLKSKL